MRLFVNFALGLHCKNEGPDGPSILQIVVSFCVYKMKLQSFPFRKSPMYLNIKEKLTSTKLIARCGFVTYLNSNSQSWRISEGKPYKVYLLTDPIWFTLSLSISFSLYQFEWIATKKIQRVKQPGHLFWPKQSEGKKIKQSLRHGLHDEKNVFILFFEIVIHCIFGTYSCMIMLISQYKNPESWIKFQFVPLKHGR